MEIVKLRHIACSQAYYSLPVSTPSLRLSRHRCATFKTHTTLPLSALQCSVFRQGLATGATVNGTVKAAPEPRGADLPQTELTWRNARPVNNGSRCADFGRLFRQAKLKIEGDGREGTGTMNEQRGVCSTRPEVLPLFRESGARFFGEVGVSSKSGPDRLDARNLQSLVGLQNVFKKVDDNTVFKIQNRIINAFWFF